MTPSAQDRRRAVQYARQVMDAELADKAVPVDDYELANLAATLLLCQRVFQERLAPVYHAACEVVSKPTNEQWDAFVRVVHAAQESERKEQP